MDLTTLALREGRTAAVLATRHGVSRRRLQGVLRRASVAFATRGVYRIRRAIIANGSQCQNCRKAWLKGAQTVGLGILTVELQKTVP